MDISKRYKKAVSKITLLSLPEDAVRAIFHHLELSLVYFTMRLVCKKMKAYVDNYVSLGGIFLVIGNAVSSELLYVFQKAPTSFKVYWKGMTSVESQNFIRQDNPYLRYERPNYFIWNNKVMCCIFQISEVSLPFKNGYVLFQYNLPTNSWKLVFENINVCKYANEPLSKEHCHPFILPEGTWPYQLSQSRYKCNYNYSYAWYRDSGPYIEIKSVLDTDIIEGVIFCPGKLSLKFPKDIRKLLDFSMVGLGPQKVGVVGGFWTQKKSGLLSLADGNRGMTDSFETPKSYFNHNIHLGTVSINGSDTVWDCKYIPNIPSRCRPLCFKMKNNLYIAGHCSYSPLLEDNNPWDQWKKEDPDMWHTFCENHSDFKDCICCDRFDISESKYYRNVHSLPTPLNRMYHPKLTTDRRENFAVIEFFDPVDSKDMIWIFTEQEGFQEHFNPRTRECFSDISSQYTEEGPRRRKGARLQDLYSLSAKCKDQILRIK